MEAAQALALAVLSGTGGNDADHVALAFRRVLGRSPTEDERETLLNLLIKTRQRLADGWIPSGELATGKSDRLEGLPAGVTPTQLAAYTAVSRVILNLDEAITKE